MMIRQVSADYIGRQDEIGTPYCVTVDVQSMDDRQVTVRERDSMRQVRVPIEGVVDYLTDCLNRGELLEMAG